jgi:hypothetical protein
MAKSLEFFGALANIEHGPEKNTVLETLANEIEGFHLLKQVYEPGVMYASVNWRGVLTDSASVAAIAALLWSIYIDKVEPLLAKEQNPKPMLVIQIKDSDGNCENFIIDGRYSDKEVFILEFNEKVERLRTSGDKESDTMIDRMEKSGRWIKIK